MKQCCYLSCTKISPKKSFSSVNFSESDIPSSRWLLSHLNLHFEDMIEVQCRQRRYGTLVYHKNCDLVHALSSVLGRH